MSDNSYEPQDKNKRGGPKTKEGKSRISNNALKHGLTSAKLILPSESLEEFHSLRDRLIEELKPETQTQELICLSIAVNFWRLFRYFRVEAGLFIDEMNEITEPSSAVDKYLLRDRKTTSEADGLAMVRISNSSASLVHVARYQTTIERSIYRGLRELAVLQGRGEFVS